MSDAISVMNVGKAFRYVAHARSSTLKDAVIKRLFLPEDQKQHTVQALSDISFAVEHGKMLGIIGRNGSGKTTLLRLLAGVFQPDSGSIVLDGALAPLLALGAGFHPDLTGRENARMELLVLGFPRSATEGKMDAIIAFSEIGDFIDAPVRTYSSGMLMRLAFAVAVCVDPDILLLDEVLAVGDDLFAQKCLMCIEDFKDRGKTIVLVSHNTGIIERWCDRVLWLDRGRIKMFGEPSEVVQAYAQSDVSVGFVQTGV